jgi:hypothetical protein
VQSFATKLTDSQHPATFRDRGAAVPFTAPLLAGARVRKSSRRGIELIVPNPSGARGVYIVHWPGVRELCNPTLHDRMLVHSISRLPRLDPAAIREAALEVAIEGYAGRSAAAAAEATRAGDVSQRLLAQFLLLAELVEQIEPTGWRPSTLAERTPEFDRRAGNLLRRIAPSFDCPAANLAHGLVTMAIMLVPIGVGRDNRAARIPRLIAWLDDARSNLVQWLAADTENDIGGLGRTVTGTMKVLGDGATSILARTRGLAADPTALLRAWVANADDTQDLLSRCDWLLDGCERIGLLWKIAGSAASRRAALLEMAQLLPVLPQETVNWIPNAIPPEVMDPVCRVVSRDDSWRAGGSAFALIQRNETLRAMSA